MAGGAQAVQPVAVAAFSVLVMRAGEGYEYEIKDKADGVLVPEIAEALFSIALDIKATEGGKNR